jgi:bla regulator protein BlaR1
MTSCVPLLLMAAVVTAQVFDVASVKPNRKAWYPGFPMDNSNVYIPQGRFSASLDLWSYIAFAYKLAPNVEQRRDAVAHYPKELSTDEYFEIDARAEGRPGKDQLRLMLQSLLAERFKLVVHFEAREMPVLALTLAKPGKTGPRLRPHSAGPPCPDVVATPPMPAPPTVAAIRGVFPANCDSWQMAYPSNGVRLSGARNTTMPLIAELIYRFGVGAGDVDKPVVDRTGLNGNFDFSVEYLPGTSFRDAVRRQLGLQLTPSRAPMRVLILDHVERPSEN